MNILIAKHSLQEITTYDFELWSSKSNKRRLQHFTSVSHICIYFFVKIDKKNIEVRKDREIGDVKQAIADAKAEKLQLIKDFEDTKSRTAGLQAALASARGKLSDAIDVILSS